MSVLAIHHVSIIVASTGRALDFYSGLLGLSVDLTRPDLGYPGAWLTVGSQQIHLLEVPNPDATEGRPHHGGRDRHLALLIDNLQSIRHQLDAAHIPYTLSKSGRKALFCRDYDGNVVELIEA